MMVTLCIVEHLYSVGGLWAFSYYILHLASVIFYYYCFKYYLIF